MNVPTEKKNDYQKQLDAILATLKAGAPAAEKPSLLLHACCAPCSSYVLEYLSYYFNITIFYYNPNIYPTEEYNRRLEELRVFLGKFTPSLVTGVQLTEAPYEQKDFYEATGVLHDKTLQTEPERGERCRRCYLFRMKKAYAYAQEHHFDYFTTTLSISPYKDAKKINDIGNEIMQTGTVKFLTSDFKKRNGFLRSLQLSKEYGLYRQDYCGCFYSKQNKENNTTMEEK